MTETESELHSRLEERDADIEALEADLSAEKIRADRMRDQRDEARSEAARLRAIESQARASIARHGGRDLLAAIEAERDEARAEVGVWKNATDHNHKAALKAERERDEARATIGRLGERVAYYRDSEVPALRSNADGWAARAEKAERERDEARSKIGAVKALAAEWERTPAEDPTSVPWIVAEALMHKAAADLRAALATQPTEARP